MIPSGVASGVTNAHRDFLATGFGLSDNRGLLLWRISLGMREDGYGSAATSTPCRKGVRQGIEQGLEHERALLRRAAKQRHSSERPPSVCRECCPASRTRRLQREPTKISVRKKRIRAALNDGFRDKVLMGQ